MANTRGWEVNRILKRYRPRTATASSSVGRSLRERQYISRSEMTTLLAIHVAAILGVEFGVTGSRGVGERLVVVAAGIYGDEIADE